MSAFVFCFFFFFFFFFFCLSHESSGYICKALSNSSASLYTFAVDLEISPCLSHFSSDQHGVTSNKFHFLLRKKIIITIIISHCSRYLFGSFGSFCSYRLPRCLHHTVRSYFILSSPFLKDHAPPPTHPIPTAVTVRSV